MIIQVRWGDKTMPASVFNGDCDCDILLDAIRRRAIKETEAFARERDAQLTAGKEEASQELREAKEADPQQDADKIAKLEAVVAHRERQREVLMEGAKKFKDICAVDLVDGNGNGLGLDAQPKVRASELLAHRQVYVLARRDPVLSESGEPTEETRTAALAFEVPVDDPDEAKKAAAPPETKSKKK